MKPAENLTRRRVMIVEDDTYIIAGLKDQLARMGDVVVGDASTAQQAETIYREMRPDVVLMDIRLDGTDGITLAEQLLGIRRCAVVVLSAFSDKALIQRAAAAGVFGYLVKPVSGDGLAAQMEVAVRRFVEHEKLLADKAELMLQLETRKLMEKAKGILMKRLNLDEPEAHRRLQQESQKRRISMGELCKKLIDSEDILGGS